MKRTLMISGKQGSGKTSTSDEVMWLAKKAGFYVSVFKFADPIYAIHNAALPILKEYGIIPESMSKDGEFLQVVGTEYGRAKRGDRVWVDICRRRVDKFLSEHPKNLAVVDDCRFENEFDTMKDISLTVRLNCDREVRKSRVSYWRDNDTHASEVGLDSYADQARFDIEINSEIECLDEVAKRILSQWLHGG